MNTFIKRVAWFILLAPAVYLAATWNRLPEKIPMQYNLAGEPSRYGNRSELLIMIIVLTVMTALIYVFLPEIYRIDPKKNAAENKDRLFRIAFALTIMMTAVQCLIIYSSIENNMDVSISLIFAGVGLLFAIIGNYLPNLKPNYFAGLRLPWTLENEENWRKTHLLAGKIWFAGGLLLAVLCLFIPAPASMIVFFAVTCIMVIIPCVFSYRMYKKNKTLG